ncbi:hypothetical protein ABZ543_12695 [Streptomyces roseifaciens]
METAHAIQDGGCVPPKTTATEDSATHQDPPHETTALEVRTAFLVIQHPNGEWEATHANLAVAPQHAPTVTEMKIGCAEVVSDIEASKLAAFTAQQFMALAVQTQEQTAVKHLAKSLNL